MHCWQDSGIDQGFSQGPPFFVREILDRIGPYPGGAIPYIGTARICPNPVLNIMVYPDHRWYEYEQILSILGPDSGMKFFEPAIFSKKLITEKISLKKFVG